MSKIRYKLLLRSSAVFALLAAALVSAILALSFEKSLESERTHIADRLNACIRGIQSTYALYAVQGAQASDEALLKAAKQTDASAKIEKSAADDITAITVSGSRLTASGNMRLGQSEYRVTIEGDLTDLFEYRSNFLKLYRIMYLVCLPAGMFFMYRAGRSITRSVETLKSASDALCGGDYESRADVKTGDEIEALSDSFNRMADAVQKEMDKREKLIGNLTHEMKTPLQAILGHADLIRMDRLSEEGRLLAAQTIRLEALRLDRLSARMMEWIYSGFSESVNPAPVSAAHMAENVKRAFETRAEIKTFSEDASVYADSVLIETLLMNLVDNSINAGAKNIFLTAERRNGKVIFSVKDDGCGMEEQTLLHAEEPFYREDKARTRAHGGAGLGLSLAARIASLHNTRLSYTSEKGKGTSVEFALEEVEND